MYVHAMDHEPDPASAPPTVQLVGTVELAAEGERIPVSATLRMIPGRTITFACSARADLLSGWQTEMLTDPDVSWEVSGTMTDRDEQRPLQCSKLQCIQTGVGFSEREGPWWHGMFVPVERLVLGSQQASHQHVRAASFALMTYLGTEVNISVDGWEYVIRTCSHRASLSRQAWAWHSPLETAILRVEPDSPTSLEDILDRVSTFLLMLSFTQGEDISYNRYEIRAEQREAAEMWEWLRVHNPVLARSVGFVHEQDFVPSALANYAALEVKQQNLVKLAIHYHLQAKRQSILEPAFVSEAIAWEMMTEEPKYLSPPLRNLRDRVKSVHKNWQRRYPEDSKGGMYGSRLTTCMWQSLQEGITLLIGEVGLEWLLDKKRRASAGLPNPYKLIEYRNSIVHNGCLPHREEGEKEHFEMLKGLLRIGDLIFVEKLCPGATENFFSA